MEIHDRFMKIRTTGVDVVETLAGNCKKDSSIIHELVEAYNKKISKDFLDLKTLETFRMILCYEYKSMVKLHKEDDPLKCTGSLYIDLRSFLIKDNEYRKREEFAVLCDIVILQLVLHSNKQLLITSFKDFCEIQGLLSSTENRDLAMRIAECVADSYNLHTYLYKSMDNSAELREQSTRILAIIQSWIKQEEGIEWKLLAALLPKLTTVFDPQKIISPLWLQVLGSPSIERPFWGRFNDITDLDKKLAALCVMADVCFSSKKENIQEFHYEQCVQNEFWWILNRGLICTVFQQRKQALYLIKRAVEFAETHKSEIKKRLKPKQTTMPFLCTRLEGQESCLEEIKKNFFLILEVLEEKQKHLVLPALSHLPSFAKVHADHKLCSCDCFNPMWIRCIFKRILQHDNDSIKIFGMQEILKSVSYIFRDEDFLYFILDALNNTFLYECNVGEEKPEIVKDLVECLLRWEQEKINYINLFVRTLSSISWSPVAIYWILEALHAVSNRCTISTNVWTDMELHCVESLIQKSLMSHNLKLRTYSQVFIIRILRAYASMPADHSTSKCIFNILSLFLENKSLQPASNEWIKTTEYLSKIIEPSDALQYITQRCEKLSMVEQSLKSFALLIGLLSNSNLILVAKPCPAEKALQNLFQILVGADLRPYADQVAILKVMELWSHSIDLTSPNEFPFLGKIEKLMLPYHDEIIKIVNRSLERKTNLAYDEYLFACSALIRNSRHPHDSLKFDCSIEWPNVKNVLERFEDKCIHIIANSHNFSRTQWSYAIKMLYLCRKQDFSNRPELEKTYIPPLLRYFRSELIENKQEENANKKNDGSKGKFASDCFETIARLLCLCIIESPSYLRPPDVNWFQELQALIDTGNEHVIDPVAAALYGLLKECQPLSIQDIDHVNSIIRVSWRNVFQLKRTPVFFSALEQLTQLIVSGYFLRLDGAKEYAIECVDQMMREGESVPTFKRIFLNSMKSLVSEDIVHFQKAFMSCLLHGVVQRRDQRIEQSAILHGRQFCNVYRDLNVDTTVRAQAVIKLINIIKSSLETDPLRKNVLNNLLEILQQHKNRRYFDNSNLHRLKHRVMQTLLILEPYLTKTERQHLYDFLWDLLIAESNQPSVRLMQEWLLINLYSRNEDMRDTIWTLFETAAEKRPGSIVSLASVVFHVAHSLSEQTQREYIAKAISRLLPNCMGQQFNVRLYSQTILVKIYEMLPKDSLEAKTYREIFKGVEESLRRGNLMKNSKKVLDDFYFKFFNPFVNYNLETIYQELPRLTNVSADEWISPEVFLSLPNSEILDFNENRDSLRTVKPSEQSSKEMGELAEYSDSSKGGGLSDIQKKIIPWKTMVPFYDDLSEISKAKLLQRKMQNEEVGIIVVASLIDRPPNLGGLARTCEIFGAKELVIGSLRFAEDREFQTLSVSAEKWISITEVKPHLLQNYLLEKQSKGWKLIGAEQTANSTNLLEIEFPKKTILLLGNEKDGIPANLIPLLDTCVEIPQSGVVRSLNVHVTGAICIWQYAKQHVFT